MNSLCTTQNRCFLQVVQIYRGDWRVIFPDGDRCVAALPVIEKPREAVEMTPFKPG
jgi:hypothetical protein